MDVRKLGIELHEEEIQAAQRKEEHARKRMYWIVVVSLMIFSTSTPVIGVVSTVSTGGVLSTTVMIWSHVVVLPQSSAAVQVRVIVSV